MVDRKATTNERLDRVEDQLARAVGLINTLAEMQKQSREEMREFGLRMDNHAGEMRELGLRMDNYAGEMRELGPRMDNYAKAVVVGFSNAASHHGSLEDRVDAIDKRLSNLEREIHD